MKLGSILLHYKWVFYHENQVLRFSVGFWDTGEEERERLKKKKERKAGAVWVWSHDHLASSNGCPVMDVSTC